MGTDSGTEWAAERLSWPVGAGMADPGLALGQLVERAAWSGFDSWWSKVAGVGFCARPIHLVGVDLTGREHAVLARCKNRRASVCPSCSDLYAADTWQLVTAGVVGGRHGMPHTVASHPAVFVTLTAPSFGPVHGVRAGASGGARRCQRPVRVASTPNYRRCVHGKPLWCNAIHDNHNHDVVGQPLCAQCYDYLGHVLFSGWAPELWRRFTIAVRRVLRSELRRRGEDPDAVAVSFVKVVEVQARAIPHYHTLIRLDATPTEWGEPVAAPQTSITATELAALAQIAAGQVRLTVADADGGSRALRFGEQIDTQPLTADRRHRHDRRRLGCGATGGGYLAKYVTKSVGKFGLRSRGYPRRPSSKFSMSARMCAPF
ncbi:MAG TPA: replication initiator [Mycobacterium sp.]|nr:replication initiator [Mycobacterium sp.]